MLRSAPMAVLSSPVSKPLWPRCAVAPVLGTAFALRPEHRAVHGSYSLALSQPAYNRAHYVGIIIGPDALSGIGRQERPISRLRERTEILILARHRGDGRDPLLLARIFLNVAALIEARNRAVCMDDAGA